jgi:glycosyltransferase involved in cell wall biosynthesis
MAEDWLDRASDHGLVSVIVPVHNQERFLRDCLQSVVDQDYKPLEIIIVDDGSTDGSGKIISEFQAIRREGISVGALHQTRQGAQEARNNGCRTARGEYFLFLDGDDFLDRHNLVEQVKEFKGNPDADVVYSDGQYLSDGFECPTENGGVLSLGEPTDVVAALLSGLSVPCFSYLFRRQAVQRCGPWDPTIPINQDIEFVLRLATSGCRFRYAAGLSGFYRKHSANTISEQSKSLRGRTMQGILEQTERRLKERGELGEARVDAMIDNYRRIARQIYSTDIECFERSLDAVHRLRPKYRPEKPRARRLASVIGFRNYERVAAVLSHWRQKIRGLRG